jgi:hypothetical protein
MLHKFGGIVEDGQMAGYEREFQILQEFLSGNWFLFYLLRREQKTWGAYLIDFIVTSKRIKIGKK